MDTEGRTIENGMIMGNVSTRLVGSEIIFEICSVEEWEEMTEDEVDDVVQEAMFDCIDWGY